MANGRGVSKTQRKQAVSSERRKRDRFYLEGQMIVCLY
jgi:hypothetical protein